MGRKFKDITGARFGKLMVIKHLGLFTKLKPYQKPLNKRAMVEAKCDCGTIVKAWAFRLILGSKTHCGCAPKYVFTKRKKKAPIKLHPLFGVYAGMMNRCYNKKGKYYYTWGGRGIRVCKKWKGYPKCFYQWGLKNGWKKGLVFDRRDPNKNYTPSNCRFISKRESSQNLRRVYFIEYNGERKTIMDWAIEIKMAYRTLKGRLIDRKWAIEKALLTPPRHLNKY